MAHFHHHTPKHRRTLLERAEKFISTKYFADVNLFGRLYTRRLPVKSILHYGPTKDGYQEVTNKKKLFQEFSLGSAFGNTFSQHWFEVCIEIPDSWIGQRIQLLWDAGCEGMIYRNGVPVFAISPIDDCGIKKSYTISEKQVESVKIQLFVSVSCNRLLGEGKNGLINPPDLEKTFSLSQAEIVTVNREAYQAFLDVLVIYDITKSLPEECQRGYEGLFTLNEIINTLVCGDFSTKAYKEANATANRYLHTTNRQGQHTVHAIGHCHIDCAWLWPYSSTIHKCARSWLSTVSLMDKYPKFNFACSQAQQFAWVKEHYPKIYSRVKEYVRKGRFIPVGGTWVEMDGNMPSGESMVRQFYHGQKFFREEFGITCAEFWLPDTFGYSANFPQIMKEAKIMSFLTQKISWNLVNIFPHNTFLWEGIDGTKTLTHFPPGDCYCMSGTAEELLKTMNNHKDKGRSDTSMFLFGHGDGGGGVTEAMLERLSRMNDCAELPKLEMSTPQRFFDQARSCSKQLCTWVGELFLELHNGTYTTQAKIKKFNRQCEILLHNAEFTTGLAWLFYHLNKIEGYNYPAGELDRIWKIFLLNQFHDVLPGSSIEMVTKDAWESYEDVLKSTKMLMGEALHKILPDRKSNQLTVLNSLSWDREEVVKLPDGTLAFVHAPSLGYGPCKQIDVPGVKVWQNDEGTISMMNSKLKCSFDKCGRLLSLLSTGDSSKEFIKQGNSGNQMLIFDDVPLFWDAWDVMDYHLETRKPLSEVIDPLRISEHSHPLRGALEFSIRISDKSVLRQTIQLESESPILIFNTTVDWHENHKFLKVEFPFNVLSPRATYEIQFGHLERPTHQNTSWDSAKFEVWGHKWADLSQYDRGVALLNDSKYGYSTFGNVMRLSLLRSPKAPDENADMGEHTFSYALFPHKGSFQALGVVKQAYQFNNHLHVIKGSDKEESVFSFAKLDTDAVILDTVKKSDLHEGAMLIRLYESFGSSVTSIVEFPRFKIEKIKRCNILEDVDDVTEVKIAQCNMFQAEFSPFQIQSFLVWLV